MSANGYFDDIDDSLDLNPLETELGTEKDIENFDAFNEETFDCALEGDWEAEHDKLIMLEGNDGLSNTLTKFDNDNYDDEEESKRENYLDDDENDYLNGYNQTKNSKILLDKNSVKQINSKNNVLSSTLANSHSPNSNKTSLQDKCSYLTEEQVKLFAVNKFLFFN